MSGAARLTELSRTLGVVAVGLLVSAFLWWASASAQRQSGERAFEQRAALDAMKLEAHFAKLERPVITAADFFSADRGATPESFARFADFIVPRAPIIRWLAWAPIVHDIHRAAFEVQARLTRPSFHILDRARDGSLVHAPERDNYVPLYAVRAVHAATPPLGLDLESDAAQRAAAERARDEGKAIATVPLSGFDPRGSGKIVTVIAPVYHSGNTVPSTVAERRQRLVGYMIGAYTLRAVLRYVTAGVARPAETISFTRSVPAAAPGKVLASPLGIALHASAGPGRLPRAAGEDRVIVPVSLAGKSWNATFSFRAPRGILSQSDAPFGWLGAGLVLTAALGAFIARGETQRLATQRLVTKRTVELSEANARLHDLAEMLRATLDAAPIGIIALNKDAKITLWNRGAERTFGHQADDVLGKAYLDLVTPKEERASADALYARISTGESIRDIEMQRRRSDGTLLDIRGGANPVYDATGRFRGVVIAVQDITDSRKLEAQLRQSQKLEAIGQLTGGVAHDFNNLLGAAITSLDLLREQIEGDSQADELAADALNALLHGADLVRRLLAFARRHPLQPERVDINDLVTETARLLRPLLGDSIELVLKLGDGIWPVLTDRPQFETTLINLATNGRDAMPYGGQLFIATHNTVIPQTTGGNPEVPPGEYVTVEIRDTGTGMHPSTLQRIFEPFFTTKDSGAGTGLGLSTVLGFMKQLGGYIIAESEEGVGSCFRLYLRRFDGVEDDYAQQDETLGPMSRLSGTGKRVLVVEDNAGLRRSVILQLQKLGFRTRDVANASAALALLGSTEQFDLLFSDVMLPGGMGGMELACVVRARWPHVRILLVSGSPELFARGVAGPPGIPLLSRPYREQALIRALDEALGAEKPAQQPAQAVFWTPALLQDGPSGVSHQPA